MASEFDGDDDDGEFGGFEVADALTVGEAQPLPPALQIGQIVQSSLASSHHAAEPRAVSVDNRINQASVVETTTTTTDISMAAVSVVADGNSSNGRLENDTCKSFIPAQTRCAVGSDSGPLPPQLNDSDSPSAVELQYCRTQLHQYEQKYAELQQLRSTEMLEMHQRTREAVDSIVQHYQKLLSETVRQCEEACKEQIKEAITCEQASLADVMQRQQEDMNKLMEERSCALEVRFDECLAEQRVKQQEIHEELRHDERRQTEEHVNALLQEKVDAIKKAVEEAVQLEQDRTKQTVSEEREQLLQLVSEERERSQNAVEELIAEERLKLQQTVENAMREYQNHVDSMMSQTLRLAQEQIKTYVDEQRRDDGVARLRLLSSIDVLLDTARAQLQNLLVTPTSPSHQTQTSSADSTEH